MTDNVLGPRWEDGQESRTKSASEFVSKLPTEPIVVRLERDDLRTRCVDAMLRAQRWCCVECCEAARNDSPVRVAETEREFDVAAKLILDAVQEAMEAEIHHSEDNDTFLQRGFVKELVVPAEYVMAALESVRHKAGVL
jgi:hypothetical protein